MSKESAKEFMLKLSEDSKMLEGLGEHSKDAQNEDERLQSICSLAKEKGYEFSLTELKDVMQESQEAGMSDDELENVAGGAATFNWKQALLGAASGMLTSFAKHGFTKDALKEGAIMGGMQGLAGLASEEQG